MLALAGCAPDARPPAPATDRASAPPPRRPSPSSLPEPRAIVVVLGDSLAQGFGLPAAETFPALLEARLRARGHPVEVVNAGVSGDTTARGLARLEAALAPGPHVLVLELGINDGVNLVAPATTRANLRRIAERALAASARVLLLGTTLPPDYGLEHGQAYARIFPELAVELAIPLVPDLLGRVTGRPELTLPDGFHPNARGQALLADKVEPALEALVAEASAAR